MVPRVGNIIGHTQSTSRLNEKRVVSTKLSKKLIKVLLTKTHIEI